MSANGWPTDAPDPKEHGYRLWPAGTDEDTAALRFQDRYGQPPGWIVEWRCWLYVGPIPERSRKVELEAAR